MSIVNHESSYMFSKHNYETILDNGKNNVTVFEVFLQYYRRKCLLVTNKSKTLFTRSFYMKYISKNPHYKRNNVFRP